MFTTRNNNRNKHENTLSFYITDKFALTNVLFDAVKLTKITEIDRYSHSRYVIGFVTRGIFTFSFLIIFGVDNGSSVHDDNRNKCILIIGNVPTDELNDTTLTGEAEYFINFTEQKNKFCLRLHYNGSFLFVNEIKISSKQKILN